MNTAFILGIIDGITKLAASLIDSQTPDQRKILWDRYLEVTEPFHKLLIKIENLGQQSQPTPPPASS